MLSRRQFTHTALTAAAATLLPIHARSQAAYGIPFRFSLMLGTLSKSAPAFEDRLAIAAKAGYQGIEFVGEWTKWTDTDYARVVPQIQSAHLTVDSMAGTGITFSDPKGVEDLEPRMAHAIAAADKLGCPQLLLTSGKRFEGSTTQVCVDNLKRILALAERAHKNVVIEPIDTLENPTIYLTGVTEAFDICRQVGSPSLKVLYDVYHEQRQAGNLLEKFQNNIDLVGLVHIADVPGRHEPGTGEIRYDQIFRLLAHLNYKGFVAMEYHALGDPFQTLVKVREDAIAAAKS
jgi:hydroxypyruvate isomerase